MASDRLKALAHEYLTQVGKGMDNLFIKLNALPNLTAEEQKDIASASEDLDAFRADIDEAHSVIETDW